MSLGLKNDNSSQVDLATTITQQSETNPVKGKKEAADQGQKVYVVLMILSLIASIILVNVLLWGNRQETVLTKAIGDLRYLSQVIVRQSEQLELTDQKQIQGLENSRKQAVTALQIVEGIHPDQGRVDQLGAEWQQLNKHISTLIATRPVVGSDQYAAVLKTNMTEILSHYQAIHKHMQETNYANAQLAIANRQMVLTQGVLDALKQYESGQLSKDKFVEKITLDLGVLAVQLQGQIQGNPEQQIQQILHPDIKARLAQVDTKLKQVAGSANRAATQSVETTQAVNPVLTGINQLSNKMLIVLDDLAASTTPSWLGIGPWVLLAVLLLLLFAFYQWVMLRRKHEQQQVMQIQTEYTRNQNAILRLLDEIADLADGDLRSHATVTADFTGAIADAINSAIDDLRDLVTRIHVTSEEVSNYSAETQLMAMRLSEASTQNAQEIANASEAIHLMAGSIDEVSLHATESAEVAKRSVDIAQTGVEMVNRTIKGMDTIREQIQQTSKRIKRLGESSQEIGHIVSLINDIADQTNILALNAAIQASMAGEAGRGFAVVADEVQRLAERSAVATKQIEQLVKTIQNDTNEAVNSMELTTAEVVNGTTLAKDAGITLGEIQNVSGTLANLIDNISDNAREQSLTASQISITMNVVQGITHQTTSSSMNAAQSVTELAHMAEDLRDSVSNFKLPA